MRREGSEVTCRSFYVTEIGSPGLAVITSTHRTISPATVRYSCYSYRLPTSFTSRNVPEALGENIATPCRLGMLFLTLLRSRVLSLWQGFLTPFPPQALGLAFYIPVRVLLLTRSLFEPCQLEVEEVLSVSHH